MISLNLIIIFLLSTTYAIKTDPSKNYYHAAVVEYSSLPPQNGKDSLMTNAVEYVKIINTAGSEADVIVFPELGLQMYDYYRTFVKIPFGDNIPAPTDDKEAHPALRMISEAARENNIYVVINFHEEYDSDNQKLHYNTNVVFNRTGNIIKRYRKYNLFGEPLNITKVPEEVYFDSDFGVRFGTFVCFDILFEKPTQELLRQHNVTDILYPTFWYSGLPFFTAVQTQAAWAYATDTNLLASGGNRVETATTGSGIYAGRKGPIVYLQSQRNETTILYAKIYKKGKSGISTGRISRIKDGVQKKLSLWGDPVISDMKSELIVIPKYVNVSTFRQANDSYVADLQIRRDLCFHEFCCSFDINMSAEYKLKKDSSHVPQNPYLYRIAVFDGLTRYHIRNAGVQFCSLISCLHMSKESCGKPINDSSISFIVKDSSSAEYFLYSTIFHSVSITTKSLDQNSFVMPDLFQFSSDPNVYGSLMNTSQYFFNLNEHEAQLRYSSDKLVTGGIYARVFSRDSKSSSSLIYFNSLRLLVLSSVLYFLLTWNGVSLSI